MRPRADVRLWVRLRRWARWGLSAFLAPLIAYLLATIGCGLAPANLGRIAPGVGEGESVRIYVASNGVHTDLLLPTNVAGVDWRETFPVTDFRAVAEDAPYIGFGWGDRDFYMSTPSWSDVSAGLVWRALTGTGPSVLKVGNYLEPAAGGRIASLLLSVEEYHRLAGYVRAALVLRSDDRPLAYPGSGYGDHDAFYAANGRYSLFDTCNEWVARGLREAGVTAPRWSPFAEPILWWMKTGEP